MTADDIVREFPDIKLKKDVPAKDVHGNKVTIPEDEVLTPYELKGNKILLQDGKTYVVTKNQFQNIKGQSISGEAKPFAPELEGVEESVKGDYSPETNALYKQLEAKNKGKDFDDWVNADQEIWMNKRGKPKTTKYESYQLPEGKKYKEILIKAPTRENSPYLLVDNKSGNLVKEFKNIKEARAYYLDKSKVPNPTDFHIAPKEVIATFNSSHWKEPNVLSHLRMNDRTYKGKKVSFMEELQSDWAREGRDKGFIGSKDDVLKELESKGIFIEKDMSGGADIVDKKGNFIEYDNLSARNKKLVDDYSGDAETFSDMQGVPSHPLVKGNKWQEPSIKRALKEAVDNNSDYFAWISVCI